MAMNDTLSAALSKIMNAERIGKKDCVLRPVSRIIKSVMQIMNEQGYVGTFEEIKDGRGGMLYLNLLSHINKCGSIKPRFSTMVGDFEKWEKRYLPAKGFGVIIVSTPQGMMTHEQAKKKGIGGKLVAYCY